MVSSAVAQAILNQPTPDILGQFRQGQEYQRGQSIRKFAGMAAKGDSEAMRELESLDPSIALALQQSLGARDQASVARAIEDARIAKNLIEAGRPQDARVFIGNRLKALKSMGANADQTQNVLDVFDNEGPDAAYQALSGFTDALEQGKQVSQKSFAPIVIENPDTGEKRLVSPTVDPRTGAASLSPYDLPPGFQVTQETAEEKRRGDIKAAGEKKTAEVTAKGIGEREQRYIDSGVEAVDSMASIQEAITLLDDVKTGGIDSVKLRAKQMFGIESADEGELANALGTAVLANLKPIFGAAFTAQEGERLERISASFGKSPETNKRLLQKQMEIAERAARRALSAAKKAGDDFTVQEIEQALERVKAIKSGESKPVDESLKSEAPDINALVNKYRSK